MDAGKTGRGWSRRGAAGGLAAFLICASAYTALSETVTMSTYYPSPMGIYNKLVATGQVLLSRDGGRVGVGTSAPQVSQDGRTLLLDVAGNATASDAYLKNPKTGSAGWVSDLIAAAGSGGRYQAICLEGQGAGEVCMRINTENGQVDSRAMTGYGSWVALPTVFAATAAGKYSLTCNMGIYVYSLPLCCRLNAATGAAQCVVSPDRDFSSWNNIGAPW